jgi:hypothetical protein
MLSGQGRPPRLCWPVVSVDQLRWYVQQQQRWPHCCSTKEAITEADLAIARELYQTDYIIACSIHTGTSIYFSGLCGVSNCVCRRGVRQHAWRTIVCIYT